MSTDRANPSLWIGLLGPPEVIWAGATLSIVRRQTRALLYRLAVHLSPVPRTQLGYLFWPDVPDTTARRNLTHLLTLLRRALPRPDQHCRCPGPALRPGRSAGPLWRPVPRRIRAARLSRI